MWVKLTGKDRAFAPRERVSKQQKQAVAVKLQEAAVGAAKASSSRQAGATLQSVWGSGASDDED
jgi:hypothetical protein